MTLSWPLPPPSTGLNSPHAMLEPRTLTKRSASTDGFVDALFTAPRELIHGSDMRRADLVDRIATGGFPDIVARSPSRRRAWFDNYLTTATQSVIREISPIERLAEMPRVLRLCAARTGAELNVSALANDLSIPARTTAGYLALLEAAFLIHRVPAWSTNLSRKVIRRPKLVVSDSGLACHLLGVTGATLDRPGRPLGPLLETFVANEIRKQLTWSTERPSLWHFRDRGGAEVDLVLEHPDGRVCGIEVKATSTPRAEDLRGLRYLAERLDDRFQFGVLLTAAPEATPFGPTLAALPVSTLWAG